MPVQLPEREPRERLPALAERVLLRLEAPPVQQLEQEQEPQPVALQEQVVPALPAQQLEQEP